MFRWSLLAETKREFLVPSIVYCEFCLGVLWFWLHNFDPNLAVGGGKRNGATSISWCYIHPPYIKLLRTGVSLGAHASAAQIDKYTLEIQQIRPKYSLYLNCTNFPNDDNFGLRSSISLSKVRFGIYRLMLIILRGRKYTNTLWKYKYTSNTVLF